MIKIKIFLFSVFGILLASCSTTPEQKMYQTSLAPDSRKAIVLIKVEGPKDNLLLQLLKMNSETGNTKVSILSGAGIANFPLQSAQSDYVFTSVSPGRYFVSAFTQQSHWGLCFIKDTYFFDVKAGQVNYIGSFNTKPHKLQLLTNALRKGNLSARQSTTYYYYDDILRPSITPAKMEDVLSAKHFFNKNIPGVTAEVVMQSGTKWKKEEAMKLFGIIKKCG